MKQNVADSPDETTVHDFGEEPPQHEVDYDQEKPRHRAKKSPRLLKFAGANAEAFRLALWVCHFIVLLLLAPYMQSSFDFTRANGDPSVSIPYHIPMLILIVLELAAALYLRPTRLRFYLAAPALPVAFYFALQASTQYPWLLAPIALSPAGPVGYHAIRHNANREEDDRKRDDEGKLIQNKAERDHQRRLLDFSVVFLTGVMLFTGLLGGVLARRDAPPPAPPAFEETLLTDEELLTGMDKVIVSLSGWPTGKGYRTRRREILETLLGWECVTLRTKTVYQLDASEVTAISFKGSRLVPAALRTRVDTKTGDKADQQLRRRIELICYAAKLLKLRETTNSNGELKQVDKNLRKDAENYAKQRAGFYLEQIYLGE